MNAPGWRLATAVLLGFAPRPVHADDPSIAYYDIAGATSADLRREMNAKGPLGEGGKRFDGHAKWHVRWTFRYAPDGRGCGFTQIRVTVSGTITLPRWSDADLSTPLHEEWRRYLSALRLHEYGHYAHGRQAAEDVERLGLSFHASECADIADTFNREADAIVRKYAAMDKAYDQKTGHGRTEGARFPRR